MTMRIKKPFRYLLYFFQVQWFSRNRLYPQMNGKAMLNVFYCWKKEKKKTKNFFRKIHRMWTQNRFIMKWNSNLSFYSTCDSFISWWTPSNDLFFVQLICVSRARFDIDRLNSYRNRFDEKENHKTLFKWNRISKISLLLFVSFLSDTF